MHLLILITLFAPLSLNSLFAKRCVSESLLFPWPHMERNLSTRSLGSSDSGPIGLVVSPPAPRTPRYWKKYQNQSIKSFSVFLLSNFI